MFMALKKSLVFIVLVTALLSFSSCVRMNVGNNDISADTDSGSGSDQDIWKDGGTSVLIDVMTSDGKTPSEEQLDSVKAIMGKRLDGMGILDRRITVNSDNSRITLEIPIDYSIDESKVEELTRKVCARGLITFQEVDESKRDENGQYLPTGIIILQGSDIADAASEKNSQTGDPEVSIKFSNEGFQKFSDATARLIGKPIGIFMDDTFISAPVVQTQITTNSCVINMGTGDDKEAEAKNLAAIIKSGNYPVDLKTAMIESIPKAD